MKNKADIISSLFWFCFSAFITVESYRLGLGTIRQPGSGFVFFWSSLALGFMSAVIFIRACVAGRTQAFGFSPFKAWNANKLLLVLISLFLYAVLIETLGFIVVTLLLFLFLLGVVERRKIRMTLLVSVLVTAFAYLIFEIFLESQLPKGVFGL
jgi:hypothetical protein